MEAVSGEQDFLTNELLLESICRLIFNLRNLCHRSSSNRRTFYWVTKLNRSVGWHKSFVHLIMWECSLLPELLLHLSQSLELQTQLNIFSIKTLQHTMQNAHESVNYSRIVRLFLAWSFIFLRYLIITS